MFSRTEWQEPGRGSQKRKNKGNVSLMIRKHNLAGTVQLAIRSAHSVFSLKANGSGIYYYHDYFFDFPLHRSSSDVSSPCISAFTLVREIVCTCNGHVCVRETHGLVKDYNLVLLRASSYDSSERAGSVIRMNLQHCRPG